MSNIYPTDEYDPTDPWGVRKRIRDLQGPPAVPAMAPSSDASLSRPSILSSEDVFTNRDYREAPRPQEDPMAGIYRPKRVSVPEPGPFDNMHGTVTGIIGGISRAKRQSAIEHNAMEEKQYQDSLEEARLRQMHLDRQAATEERAAARQPAPPHSRKTVVNGVETWQAWNPTTQKWETDSDSPVGNKPSVADEDFARWKAENPKGTWTQYKKWAASLAPSARADYATEREPRTQILPQYENGVPTTPLLVNTRTGEPIQIRGARPNKPPAKPAEDKTLAEIDRFEAGLRKDSYLTEQEIQEKVNRFTAGVSGRRPPKPVSMGEVRERERALPAPRAASPAPTSGASKLSSFMVNPQTGHRIGKGLDGHWYDAQTGELVK